MSKKSEYPQLVKELNRYKKALGLVFNTLALYAQEENLSRNPAKKTIKKLVDRYGDLTVK